jgi:hypothetical protein
VAELLQLAKGVDGRSPCPHRCRRYDASPFPIWSLSGDVPPGELTVSLTGSLSSPKRSSARDRSSTVSATSPSSRRGSTSRVQLRLVGQAPRVRRAVEAAAERRDQRQRGLERGGDRAASEGARERRSPGLAVTR